MARMVVTGGVATGLGAASGVPPAAVRVRPRRVAPVDTEVTLLARAFVAARAAARA